MSKIKLKYHCNYCGHFIEREMDDIKPKISVRCEYCFNFLKRDDGFD